MSGKVFWLVSVALVAAIGLAFKGYDATVAALGLVLISLVTLKFSIDKSGGLIKEIKSGFDGRIGSIDSMVQDLSKVIKEQTDIREFTLGAMEKIKADMRIEVKDSVDRLAEKTIEMENGMNQMKRTFSAAFASLDDRVRAMEPQVNNLSASTGELEPEIRLQNADEGYVELQHEGNQAE